MASRKETPPPVVYQVRITLKDIYPPIWRRVLVPSTTRLHRFHQIIQVAMGWTNSHLHQFWVNGVEYGEPCLEDDYQVRDDQRLKLSQVVAKGIFLFLYTYDLGDCWQHEIFVEQVLPLCSGKQYPICLAGNRACPPEDCGGTQGYKRLIAVLQDPADPDYEDSWVWVGGKHDPEAFDLDETNQQLAKPWLQWLDDLTEREILHG